MSKKFAVITIAVVAFGACAILNSQRFCWSDWHFYSNDELIYQAVSAEVGVQHIVSGTNGLNSPEEFLRKYPHCCDVSWSKETFQPLNSVLLFFGAGRWEVDMYYRYQKPDGEHYISTIYPVDCCGQVMGRLVERN